MIQRQSLYEYCRTHGLTTTADVDAHIHAGLRSKPQSKSFDRWYYGTLSRLQTERDAAIRAYEEAIAAGLIRDFTPDERLALKADGHDDNPSVQAARRVLAKRKGRMT